jgi:hypothetical protein
MGMAYSQQINLITQAFVTGLRGILADKLFGAYIYGAAAFPDTLPTGDIDFHVILTGPLTAGESAGLENLHASLAERFPPLGAELDGYYILLDDARRPAPPQSQMWQHAIDNSWALHRAHVLTGRCIVLQGPPPVEIYPSASWSEIETALDWEIDYVEQHLQDYPDYCILNLCRLVYSFETRDVVISKAAASDWALAAFPEWTNSILLARKSYAREATPADRAVMLAEVPRFLEFAKSRILAARRK